MQASPLKYKICHQIRMGDIVRGTVVFFKSDGCNLWFVSIYPLKFPHCTYIIPLIILLFVNNIVHFHPSNRYVFSKGRYSLSPGRTDIVKGFDLHQPHFYGPFEHMNFPHVVVDAAAWMTLVDITFSVLVFTYSPFK